ncbi:MAG: bifunctional phosphoribosyl-AMP cyclohydrolase/phosphoribosyl-ATP diphosphatase HisIE [Thermaurantimonas sp.]
MTTPDFQKNPDGLLPCIVQDASTRQVLMLGYMNSEAYEKTQKERRITFYSRSKKRLWTKGETSGNFLYVVEINIDCDADTILILSNPSGPVCHTGNDTCFGATHRPTTSFLAELEAIIRDRMNTASSDSYISGLFKSGINSIAQKVGEEAVELIIESKDKDDEKFLNEAADLLFHYLILLRAKNVELRDVEEVLRSRHHRSAARKRP